MGMLKYIADKLYSNDKEVLTEDSIVSGSNTNGSWVKFPDGTLICRHTVTLGATDQTWYELFTSEFTTPWVYPEPFMDYNVSVSGSCRSSTYTWVVAQTSSPTSSILRPIRGSSNDNAWQYNMTAIGRWK